MDEKRKQIESEKKQLEKQLPPIFKKPEVFYRKLLIDVKEVVKAFFVIGFNKNTGEVYLYLYPEEGKRWVWKFPEQPPKECDHFVGLVTLTPMQFGDFYLGASGVLNRVPKLLGVGPNRVAVKYNPNEDSLNLTFLDFANHRVFKLYLRSFMRSMVFGYLDYLKNQLPVVKFTHQENEKVAVVEYYREENKLKLTSNNGETIIEESSLLPLKVILRRLLIEGLPISRAIRLQSFILFEDGGISICGLGFNETTEIILNGNVIERPALAMKLLTVLT